MFYLSRGEQLVLFALLALLLTGAGVLTYAKGQHSARPGREEPILIAAGGGAPASEAVVHVSGAVAAPGVYRLAPGARVGDAIETAGGATPEADLGALNLAAPVQDGGKLVVPTAGGSEGGAVGPTTGRAQRTQGPRIVSLNSATKRDLESLPGIGPVYAERIIAYREQRMRERGHGFQSVDELLNIPGIGPKRLAALRDLVTL